MIRRKFRDRPTPTIGEADLPIWRYEPSLALVDLALVDHALKTFAGRTLVSGHEVINSLLDLRNALAETEVLRQLDDGDLISR